MADKKKKKSKSISKRFPLAGRRWGRPVPERLSEKGVRADQEQRRRVRGGRSANGLRPDRRALLALPGARRHARHRDHGQGHGKRVPDGRRGDDARDRALPRRGVPLQHVRRQPAGVCGGLGGVKSTYTRTTTGGDEDRSDRTSTTPEGGGGPRPQNALLPLLESTSYTRGRPSPPLSLADFNSNNVNLGVVGARSIISDTSLSLSVVLPRTLYSDFFRPRFHG